MSQWLCLAQEETGKERGKKNGKKNSGFSGVFFPVVFLFFSNCPPNQSNCFLSPTAGNQESEV